MSKFVDSEALEDDDEEEEEGVDIRRSSSRRDGGDGSDGEEGDRDEYDSSEEDEDQPNEYEADDFLVNDDEEGEDDDERARERKLKKKKRRAHTEPEFEEGDLQLLEEAGVKVKKRGKLRRLKRHSDDEAEEEDIEVDEEEERRPGPDEDIDYDRDDEDAMENFIEDDDGDRRKRRGGAGMNSAAIDEAHRIFGDQFEVENLEGIDVVLSNEEDGSEDNEPMTREPDVDEAADEAELQDLRKLTIKLDPSLADDRYLTERDEEIRTKDMPEYLQEHFGSRERSSKEVLGEEAEWIYESAFQNNPFYEDIDRKAVVEKISVALAFLHVETLDVPFVAVYRKEYVMDDLMRRSPFDDFGDWQGLWTVLDWDKRWSHLCERRRKVAVLIEKAEESGVRPDHLRMLSHHTRMATSEGELGSVQRNVQLLQERHRALNPEGGENNSSEVKRPRRRDRYSMLCKAGLRDLASKFGISATELSENLTKCQAIHRPGEQSQVPHDMATSWATQANSSNLEDPAKCLVLARYLLVTEIAADVGIMKHVRLIFRPSAMVSTLPTPKARKDVDDNHPLRPYCTVQNKPVSTLLASRGCDYLMMKQAEEEGFAKIKIFIKDSDYNDLIEDFHRLFLSQNLSATAMEWNQQRKLVVKEALSAIIESLKRELQKELLDDAQMKLQAIVSESADRVFYQGPAQFADLDRAPSTLAIAVTEREEDDEADKPQDLSKGVAIRRYTGNAPMITFAMVDMDGEVTNAVELPGGWLRRKKDDPIPVDIADALWKNIINNYQPNCIVIGIGSGGKDPLRLKTDIVNLLSDMASRYDLSYLGHKRDEALQAEQLESRIVLVPDTPATPFSRSAHAMASLPEMTHLQRRCVALGRLAQEPLSVYAAVISDKTKYMAIPFTHFEYLLQPALRREALRRSMVRAACTVGYDINRALIHAHLRTMLQYIGGLGPRKAGALLHAISTSDDSILISRRDLLVKGFLGKNVFYSASGFLRVRDPDLAKGNATATSIRKRVRRDRKRRIDLANYEPLEDTRMHPENYNVAIKIAEQSVEDLPRKSDPSAFIFEVMDKPTLLDALDLEQYAQDLETRGRGKNRETVNLIVREFFEPFKDVRKPLRDPSEKEIFHAVSHMDPDTQLYIGALATASNCRVIPSGKGVNCTIANVVRGFIHKNDLSDQKLTEEDIVERVAPGSSIICRVLELTIGNFEVKLACRASVLNNPNQIYGYQEPEFYDRYVLRYDELRDEKLMEEEALMEEQRSLVRGKMMLKQRKGSLAARSTKHPFWKDMSSEEAEKLLADAPVGDVVIRPGSTRKSVSFTYKLYNGLVGHYKVNEERENVANNSGGVYYVETNSGSSAERFSDLNEVLARVIEPLIANYNDAVRHRKFMDGSFQELQARLKEEKRKNPSTIPYLFCPDKRRERVGSFMLGYLPGTKTVMRATIIVTPDGFKLRHVLQPSLMALFDWFKKNYRTLDTPLTGAMPAASVPAPPPPPEQYSQYNPAPPNGEILAGVPGQGGIAQTRVQPPPPPVSAYNTGIAPPAPPADDYAPPQVGPSPPQDDFTSGRDSYTPARDSYTPSRDGYAITPERSALSKDGTGSSVRDDYTPARDSYTPIREGYVAADDYTPARDSYTPARDSYTPARDSYTPTKDNYTPGRDAYTPARDAYTPAKEGYTPVGDGYAPASDNYTPARDTYTPARDQYASRQNYPPGQGSMSSGQGTFENRKGVPPPPAQTTPSMPSWRGSRPVPAWQSQEHR
mmetsp:Transcript_13013/g.40065  ORF Transcript_13013/g.40065 Transcript_13013/m.40065 type:complete len:1752 (+) Transcript_13013:53-5308(+)